MKKQALKEPRFSDLPGKTKTSTFSRAEYKRNNFMTKTIFLWKYMSFSQTPFFLPGRVENIISLCKFSSIFQKFRKHIFGWIFFSHFAVLDEIKNLQLSMWTSAEAVEIKTGVNNAQILIQESPFALQPFRSSRIYGEVYISRSAQRILNYLLFSLLLDYDSLGHSHKTCKRYRIRVSRV